ncbi:MAG: hypothetical protein MJY60_04150 [Bacteroidales bacterium]|nr:hypothetical protein [Bacteroidales bacterium]
MSGFEMTDDEIIRVWRQAAPQLINHISDIGLPAKGEQLRMVTKRAFNSIALIDFILSKEKIVETYICCYSIDYASGCLLDELARGGRLGKMTFLISNLMNQACKQKMMVVKEKFCNNPNVRLVFAGSHAKLMAIRTEGNFYIVETSANFANNSRIEQYLLENSEQMFQFHKGWIDGIAEFTTSRELRIYDFEEVENGQE